MKNKNLFTEAECDLINASFKREVIPKGEIIREVNKFTNGVLFIESGLIRTFYLQDGKDVTHFFFDENHFIAMVNSILYNKSERYRLEALEECRVQVIPFQDFMLLIERFPRLNRLTTEFLLYIIDLFSQKLNLLQFQLAADKYQFFLNEYPNLTNRVSLGNIASFLGITQQTLSVIRAKKS
ncbi:MAG: Crp/Fnr family transcriptional regulator [Bacteroidota bacterium]